MRGLVVEEKTKGKEPAERKTEDLIKKKKKGAKFEKSAQQ